jgi:sarcosine oxidase delta subunit
MLLLVHRRETDRSPALQSMVITKQTHIGGEGEKWSNADGCARLLTALR